MTMARWLTPVLLALALSAVGLSQILGDGSRGHSARIEAVVEGSEPNQNAPNPGRWQTGAPIPVPIAEIAAGEIDGVIYTGGGFTPPAGSVGLWFGAYDTTDDAWERRADLPLAVHHPGMVAAAGKVWLTGGYTAQLNVNNASRRLDAYDPSSDAWTRMADMPGRRGAHAAVYIAGEDGNGAGGGSAGPGKIYVVGGVTEAGAQDEMWIYDIAADGWTSAPGPTPREHLGAAASGGKVYVLAGRGFGLGARSGILEAYDPATETWTRLPDMPGACGGCSAAATADGRIHITGGETQGRTYGEHYVFDPAAGSWHEAAAMPTTRHGIAAAAVGERFYVIGGGRIAGLDYSTLVEWWEPGPEQEESPTPAETTTPEPSATPTLAQELPDLKGFAWEECQRVGLFVRVENVGLADAGSFVVRDATGRFDERVSELAAGASIELHDPQATGARSPVLLDADNELRESDEGNNRLAIAVPGCGGSVLLPYVYRSSRATPPPPEPSLTAAPPGWACPPPLQLCRSCPGCTATPTPAPGTPVVCPDCRSR